MKVFIIAALTADGFIAEHSDQHIDWSSTEDKKFFSMKTKQAGTMVMGSRTFATIGRSLPGRKTIVYTTKPAGITAENVTATSEAPVELIARLAKTGQESLAICGGATIYQLFLSAGVVDELYLTIEPVLFGQGISLLDKNLQVRLEMIDSRPLNTSSVLHHYKVIK